MKKSFMQKAVFILEKIINYTLAIDVALIIIVVAGVIIVRFSSKYTFQASDSIIKFLLLVMAFIPIGSNIKNDGNVRISYFKDKMNMKNKWILEMANCFVFLFYLLFLLIVSIKAGIFYIEKDFRPGAIDVCFFWLRLPVTIGCILGILFLFQKISEKIKIHLEKKKDKSILSL